MRRACLLRLLFLLLPLVIVAIYPNKTGCLYSGRAGAPISDQDLLVRYIFEDRQYDPLTRPVFMRNETVEVKVGLAMIQIVQLDEKYQRLKSNVWLMMSWYDYRFAWNPNEFAGIESINIAAHKIWKPDIVVMNNVDGEFEAIWKPNTILHSDGRVLWIPPAIFKTSCEIDVRYFPFDQQTCHMDLGSWTYTHNQVELQFYGNQTNIDLSDYVASGVWDFVEGPGDLRLDKPLHYDDRFEASSTHRRGSVSNRPIAARLTFKIVLRRKPLFYITNIIIPCVLIAILGICVFCLPTDAGEKITLSISILVTLVVYMILVSKMLPAGPKSIPLLSQFLLFTFAMTFLALCITAAVIINLNHRNPKAHPTVPSWIQGTFMNWLPPALRLQRFGKIGIRHSSHFASITIHCISFTKPIKIADGRSSSREHERLQRQRSFRLRRPAIRHSSVYSFQGKSNCTICNQLDSADILLVNINRNLNTIIKSVERITKHVTAEEKEKQVQEDWKHVASVIDRVQLIIFICVTTCGTLIILFSAPYIFSNIDQSSIINKFSYNNRGLP
ncbi:Acetylcholine receptor subunit beta-like protein [Echinococcus granulosus]|uniref:Acetylcholine receptor subunit beta-like protein n=1 Tax=Echinococcus granulosus TaxID=6210 RepID=W6UXD2_ECHGR|nr:Acetylcholine receptor subunit beta-like protein [Echinococcus granulosus]EUB58194.1 Acetylcholine receptor subunit beta-like protein [Echinococcus granulosus]